jgi:hypothetical protein
MVSAHALLLICRIENDERDRLGCTLPQVRLVEDNDNSAKELGPTALRVPPV